MYHPPAKEYIEVKIEDLSEFNQKINDIIKNCDLQLVITNLLANPNLLENSIAIMPEDLSLLLTNKPHDKSILLFSLRIITTQKDVSTILVYYVIVDDNSYLGLHSKTEEGYEGRGYNQILRSIFIIVAQHVYINGKRINFIGSFAASDISAMLMIKKFKFKPIYTPYKAFTVPKLSELSGVQVLKLKKSPEHQKILLEALNKLNLGKQFDVLDSFDLKTLLDNISEKQLEENNLKEHRDWNYVYDRDKKIDMNVIAHNDKYIRDISYNVLVQTINNKLKKCYDDDSLKALNVYYANAYEENKNAYMILS